MSTDSSCHPELYRWQGKTDEAIANLKDDVRNITDRSDARDIMLDRKLAAIDTRLAGIEQGIEGRVSYTAGRAAFFAALLATTIVNIVVGVIFITVARLWQ
jgi:hypothetical protein